MYKNAVIFSLIVTIIAMLIGMVKTDKDLADLQLKYDDATLNNYQIMMEQSIKLDSIMFEQRNLRKWFDNYESN
jgi:hypothetical protein